MYYCYIQDLDHEWIYDLWSTSCTHNDLMDILYPNESVFMVPGT